MEQAGVCRRWSEEDLHAVREITWRSWLSAYSSFIPESDLRTYFEEHYSLAALLTLVHDPTVNGFIAEVEGAPVGYVKTKLNTEEKRYYVSSIYLLPEAQGKGIGRKLMLMAAEESEANGFDRVYLGVMVKNRPALDWYSKMGFQRVETAPFTMGTTSVDHFIGYIPLTSLRACAR